MCEIAITSADADPAAQVAVCRALFESNDDGLGVVAVYRDEDEGQFDYAALKTIDPDFEGAVPRFFADNDEAWRFVIHARLATAGEETHWEAHPLITHDCPECSISMVVHNGMVSKHKAARRSLERDDHEFATDVDSEVIAHEWGEVPKTIEDDDEWEEPDISGSLNYLIFGRDAILVKITSKYRITEDFRMVCAYRDWDTSGEARSGYHRFAPDGDYQFRSETRVYTGFGGQGSYSTYGFYGGGYRGQFRNPTEADDEEGKSGGSKRRKTSSSVKKSSSKKGNSRTVAKRSSSSKTTKNATSKSSSARKSGKSGVKSSGN